MGLVLLWPLGYQALDDIVMALSDQGCAHHCAGPGRNAQLSMALFALTYQIDLKFEVNISSLWTFSCKIKCFLK